MKNLSFSLFGFLGRTSELCSSLNKVGLLLQKFNTYYIRGFLFIKMFRSFSYRLFLHNGIYLFQFDVAVISPAFQKRTTIFVHKDTEIFC